MVLKELAVRLGLDVDAASFAEGGAAVELVKAGLGKLVEIASEAVTAFKENIVEALEYGDATRKAAQSIGEESEALQELQYAAQLSDVSVEELNGATSVLIRTMRAAKGGAEEQAKAFKAAGVAITDSKGKLRAADQVIGDIAAKFETMADGPEKTALAMQLFGRSGARMIPLLNEGSKGLAEMREEARALGLVMGEDAQKASEEINDNLTRLTLISKGLWRGAIAPLLPAISDLVKQFLAWKKANAEVMRQRLQAALSGLLSVVRALGKAFSVLVGTINFFKKNWIAVVAVVVAGIAAWVVANSALAASFVATGAAAVAAGVAATTAWLAAVAPITLVAAGVAGLLILFDDIRGFFQGEDSAIGAGIDKLFGKGTSTDVIETVRNLWEEVGEAIHEAYEWIAKMVEKMEWILKWSPPALLYKGAKLAASPWVWAARKLKGAAGDAINGASAAPGEYGPQEAPTGIGADLRARAALRRLREVSAVPEGTFGPSGPPVSYVPPSSVSSQAVVQNRYQIQVTQLPGENGEHFARRVTELIDERRAAENEAMSAALPAVQ